MDLAREALEHSLGEIGWTQRWLHPQQLLEKLHDLRAQLVRALGSWLLRQQPAESRNLEGRLCLIERRTREAERRGALGDRPRVDPHAPEHLVLDLHEIARVEEVGALEQGVGDVFGTAGEQEVLAARVAQARWVGSERNPIYARLRSHWKRGPG